MKCIIRVKKVFPIGPAAQDGRLHAGDVLLEVNGTKVKDVTHLEAVNILRTAPRDVSLLVCRVENGVLPPIEELYNEIESPYDQDLRLTPKSLASGSLPTSPTAVTNPTDWPDSGEHSPSQWSRSESPIGASSPAPESHLSGFDGRHERIKMNIPDDGEVDNRPDDIETPSTRPQSSQSEFSPSEVESEGSVATPRHMLMTQAFDKSSFPPRSQSPDGVSDEENLLPDTSLRSSGRKGIDRPPEIIARRTDTPPSSASFRSSKTPTPVKTFMHDAGLSDTQTSATATPPTVQEEKYGDGASEQVQDPQGFDQNIDQEQTDEDEDTLQPGEFEVTLTKGDKGLGFTVAGGLHTTGYFYVKDVLYDPAKADGRIKPGDRLMKVNENALTGLTHKEAIALLRQTPKTVKIRFYTDLETEQSLTSDSMATPRKEREEPHTSEPKMSVQDLISRMENSRTIIKPHQYGQASAAEDQKDTERENEEEKEEEERRTEIRSSTPKNNKAEEEIVDEPGEEGLGHDDTHSSFGDVSLPIPDEFEPATSEGESQAFPVVEGTVVRVELKKPERGSLGFSLIQGDRGQSSALFVRSITPGGVAAENGKLTVGDRILQVNNQSVIGMPHNKAVALIKKAPDKVLLAVARTGGSVGSVSDGSAPTMKTRPVVTVNPSRHVRSHLGETDSDIDSDTLDDDIIRSNLSPNLPDIQEMSKGGRASGTGGRSSVSSTGGRSQHSTPNRLATPDGDNTFDSLSENEAYHRFVEHGRSPNNLDTSHDSWDDHLEAIEDSGKKGRILQDRETCVDSPSPPPTGLPSHISNTWLKSLVLVKTSPDSLNYSGRHLAANIKHLQTTLEQDVPADEYKSLRHAKLTDNCNVARLPENKTKNRYRNVLPYDATRVELHGPSPDNYINASHIHMALGKEHVHYIACQGPLPQTTGDFWRMVWENRAQVIAMVTNDMESGKVKCHRYWPDSISTPFTVYNRYEVSLTQVQSLKDFDIHHIKMEDFETGRSHRLVHLSFSSWPDHGTPDSGLPLLQYIKFLHLVHERGPIIVHCSAGIGRTGALITIDVAMAMIERDLKFDIHKIVMELRRQRQGMIQTKDQYVFCYKTVLEALMTLDKEDHAVED